ncbi:MAG: hypothetical protein J6S77_07220 [Clostridia bacterium]|nr:hypothetical protein [Clostridia bacterium]
MKNIKKARRMVICAFVAVLLVAAITAGSVVAYLKLNTGTVQNDFSVAPEHTPVIDESFDGTIKQDVKVDIGNPGYAVYVRAAIVITWKNTDGNVLGQAPVKDSDYVIELNTEAWFEEGGFYYCRNYVNSGNDSPVLIESVKLKDGAVVPAGYTLNVEIITQTIQAAGKTDDTETPAVTDAWGITVDADKHLVDPTP